MRSPYQRRRGPRIAWWQFLLLTIGILMIVFGWIRINDSRQSVPTPLPTLPPGVTPTEAEILTRSDVLPTPTIDPLEVPRTVTFPGALVSSRVILSARTATSWETRYLGDSVGHLQGTAWVGEAGGNVVLAGHVTNDRGEPGPFAYLFEANIGDEVLVSEGDETFLYHVVSKEQVPPDAIEFVRQDGVPRLTLITCDDWNYQTEQYASRLIVIAEPAQ